MKNPYETLGIPLDANLDEIKRAFRTLAIKYHPDKNFGDISFTEKFVDIKDAYDVLSDIEKRKEYNLFFDKNFGNPKSDPQENFNKESSTKKEKKYHFKSFQSVYSPTERDLQDTPPIEPIFDLWGNKISDRKEFFRFPNKIGRLMYGFSDLIKDRQPLTLQKKIKHIFIASGIGIAIGVLIYFLASLVNPIWIAVWFLLPIILIDWITIQSQKFLHTNLYIGISGFAEFSCKDTRENISVSIEVNFNDITDLYVYQIEHNRNYVYQYTEFLFIWFNRKDGKKLYYKTGTFNRKLTTDLQSPIINFCRLVEKYWTIFLLDNLESILNKNKFISFLLYFYKENTYTEYIKLSIGQITFIKSKNQEFTYKFSDIKKMYSKGNELHIQHKNFEKNLFFFKSGDEDVIPMLNLCNRLFFYRAVELLLGYKIN